MVGEDFRTVVVDLLEELLEEPVLEGVDLAALDLVVLFFGATTLGFGEDVLELAEEVDLELLEREGDDFFEGLVAVDVFGLDVFGLDVFGFEVFAFEPSDFFDCSVFSFSLPLSLLFLGAASAKLNSAIIPIVNIDSSLDYFIRTHGIYVYSICKRF